MIKAFLVRGQDTMSFEEIKSHVAGKILDCVYSDVVGCWIILTQLSPIDEGRMRVEEARAKVQQAASEQRRRHYEDVKRRRSHSEPVRAKQQAEQPLTPEQRRILYEKLFPRKAKP